MLPSAGTELLDVLICDLLFDLNSASVPESGQLCPILKKDERAAIHTSRTLAITSLVLKKGEAEEEKQDSAVSHLLFSMLKFFVVMDALMVLSRLSDGGILL